MQCYTCKNNYDHLITNKYEDFESIPINICSICDKGFGQIIKVCYKCKEFRSLPYNNETNRFRVIFDKTKLFAERYVYCCNCRYNYVKNTIDKFDLDKTEIIALIEYLKNKLNS